MKLFDEIAAAGLTLAALWQGHDDLWHCRLARGKRIVGEAFDQPSADAALRKALGSNRRSIEDLVE